MLKGLDAGLAQSLGLADSLFFLTAPFSGLGSSRSVPFPFITPPQLLNPNLK